MRSIYSTKQNCTRSLSAAELWKTAYVPVAQLDRVFGYEPKGRGFESLRARHIEKRLMI